MESEIWETIPKTNEYFINEFGTVKSFKHKKEGRILKPSIDQCGYYRIRICINGFWKLLSIGRLVAIIFIPNPENKPQVNHKDGNKSNNFVSNLEWVTAKENVRHAWITGLHKARKGIDHGCCKLTEKQVLTIRRTTNISYRKLGKKYNITYAAIFMIKANKTWKHLL